jgi:transketolase
MKKVSITSEILSNHMRRDIIDMSYRAKAAEIGSSLCIADILAVLYTDILTINPKKPEDPKRDRFILSKGHGAAALYSVLAHSGFFPKSELSKYKITGGRFHGHPSKDTAPGIECSTGSLGHGLSIGAGMALSLKKDCPQSRIFVLIGDGECNEGSIWEAAMFSATHKLSNIIAIIDENGFQGFGKTKEVHRMDLPLLWKSFGWQVISVDGHNHKELKTALEKSLRITLPTAIIAKTIAGKGLSKIENTLLAHYYVLDEETYKKNL